MPKLAAEKEADQTAPPPGREMKVSIETDQRALRLPFGQRQVLVVDYAKRQAYAQVDPAVIRIDPGHIYGERPVAAEKWCGQLNALAIYRGTRWLNVHHCCVDPFRVAFWGRDDLP